MRLEKEYNAAIDRWKNNQGESWEKEYPELTEILKRGYWYCFDNPICGILLSGVNPSFNGEEKAMPIPSFRDCSGRYWNLWKRNLAFYDASYIDLFPLRVTKQKHEFEKYVPLELKAEILRVTQRELERLKPQLIIHANKSSAFYYGTKPDAPWMGYDLERVELPGRLGEKGTLYRINGLLNDDRRINYGDDGKTKLEGSHLFVCSMQSRLKSEERINQDEITQLCEYLNIKKHMGDMRRLAVLDFTADGSAVVKVGNLGEMAYIDMFGFSPISRIVVDIENADTIERKRFLEKYIHEYREMYGEEDEVKSIIEEGYRGILSQYVPAIVTRKYHYSDCVEDERYNEAIKVIEACTERYKNLEEELKYDNEYDIENANSEGPEDLLEYILEELSLHELTIGSYQLKHSSAWYMFGHVHADINAVKLHIEQENGLPKVIDNIDEVIGIIRNSITALDAQQNLQKKLGLTDVQAKYVVSFTLRQLTGLCHQNVKDSIDEYEKRLVFLEKILK